MNTTSEYCNCPSACETTESDCEIDAYHVSPEEGWPGWMRRQLQERDFCIVVCTETYSRRFAGNEAPGTRKGAKWEGRLLRQILYENEKNECVIPVIFDPADVNHIPLELRDVTHYDLSTDDGYNRLYRALADQPLVERGPQGPMHRRFPLRAQGEREAADDSGCRFDAPVTSEKTRTREGHEEPAHRWLDWRAKWWSSTETIWHQRIGTIKILVVLIVAGQDGTAPGEMSKRTQVRKCHPQ